MSTLAEDFTYGKAFRRGDVVLLRTRTELSQAMSERLHDGLAQFSERTGIEFLLLGPEVEVIERADAEAVLSDEYLEGAKAMTRGLMQGES